MDMSDPMCWKIVNQFLKTMKELEPYMIEFEKNNIMKAKNYLSDCKVRGEER